MPEPLTPQDQIHKPPNQNENPLTLHAEYLPNIRQVSVQISVSVSSGCTESQPEISLSESRRAVTVSLVRSGTSSENDDGNGLISETIKLPARVTETSRRVLAGAQSQRAAGSNGAGAGEGGGSSSREYSYRMQIDDSELRSQKSAVEDHMDSFVPWSAGDMAPFTRAWCRVCYEVILDSPTPVNSDTDSDQKAPWTWKDLPSGNWAEMMDFWHCHKPDPEPGEQRDAEDENSLVKGYGASNQVLAAAGTVLVDVATFLVAEGDCSGLKKVKKERTDGSHPEEELVCEQCSNLVGVADPIAKGWRLFKTSLSAGVTSHSNPDEMTWESHSVELVVAAQLLELIERESARRFIVHCGKKDGLLLWVFNPDMRYSNSSSQHSITSQRAMKVFFQGTADVEAMLHPEPGKTSSLSLEELRLPVGTYSSFLAALENSNVMLPQSARTFQGSWGVGILHRFERLKGATE